VNPAELAFGLVLVIGMLGLGSFYLWRQVQTLRSLHGEQFSASEETYLRARAWRRLIGSVVMVVLALFLAGSCFLEGEYQSFIQERGPATENETQPPPENKILKPEEKDFLRRFTIYWIIALLLLFTFVIIAAFDTWATLRFGLQQHRQLQRDQKLALEQQIRQIRRESNGRH
jgi:hypothetical protein